MIKPTLLSFHNNGVLGLEQLEERFDVIKLWQENDPEAAIQANKDKVVAINCTIGHFITEKIISALPNLKIIATFSVGFDHIDVKAAKARGVHVTNTPDVLSAETADTGMALLLATSKRLAEGDIYVRVGKWLNGDMPLGVSLSKKTIGIVGLGGIGQKVAKRCEAFEMDVVYYGPRKKTVFDYKYYDDIQMMAADCDYLMLTCPGGEATMHLVDANVLDALGEDGILINIARGTVVDQVALIDALQSGRIKAAGLDVYENEPHVPEALISMDNVVLLPHVGSATMETRQAMGQLVVDNILAHFDGKDLLTEVKV